MKKWLALLLLILLTTALVLPAAAANEETRDGNVINVVLDGSTDWDSTVNNPKGLPIFAIAFEPSAANDKLVVRQNGAHGNKIFSGLDAANSGLSRLYPGTVLFKPYIKASDCTLGTPANATVMIILK